MNKKIVFSLLSVSLLFGVYSCQSKQETQGKKQVVTSDTGEQENGKILNINDLMSQAILYRPSNDQDYSSFKKSKTGLLYKFHRQNSDKQLLTVDDVVEIEMNYFLNDSLLFASSAYPKQFQMPIENSVFKGDLYEGLLMMHVGDSASFVVRADSTYLKLWEQTLPASVKSTDKVRFDIGIQKSEKRAEFSKRVYEKKKAQSDKSRNDLLIYLNDNQIVQQPRPSGLIMIPIIKGYGQKAKSGDKVMVHYVATLLDGTPYISTRSANAPVELTIGNLGKDIPRGIDEALHQMREGDVTKFIVPAHLAFGQEEKPGLPPFANFIYEIELIEIVKK